MLVEDCPHKLLEGNLKRTGFGVSPLHPQSVRFSYPITAEVASIFLWEYHTAVGGVDCRSSDHRTPAIDMVLGQSTYVQSSSLDSLRVYSLPPWTVYVSRVFQLG